MIPVYLARIASLNDINPRLYEEFTNENWVVNKTQPVPFCAVGGDNALEHLNRSMKVSGGLVGFTLNANARTKFFFHCFRTSKTSNRGQIYGRPDYRFQSTPPRLLSYYYDEREQSHPSADTENQELHGTGPFLLVDNAGSNTDLYNLVTKKAVC